MVYVKDSFTESLSVPEKATKFQVSNTLEQGNLRNNEISK